MFRTNFDKKDLPKYKKAIERYKSQTGINRFTIEEKATDGYGSVMINAMSLHDNLSKDASLFWQIFDNLNIVTDQEMLENMQYYMEYCQNNNYVSPQEWITKYKHF